MKSARRGVDYCEEEIDSLKVDDEKEAYDNFFLG